MVLFSEGLGSATSGKSTVALAVPVVVADVAFAGSAAAALPQPEMGGRCGKR